MSVPAITYPLTILHGPGHDYSRWDCPEGLVAAHAAGATALDINAQPDETDRFWPTHWRFPGEHGFRAPASVRHLPVDLMGPTQLGAFTSHSGHKIHPMREVLEKAVELDMTVCLEVKGNGDFQGLRDLVEETGARLIVMTLPHLGGKNVGYRRLAAAKRAGLPTMVLLNRTRFARGQVPAWAWAHVDYVKGPTRWQKGRPARVVRLGPGSRFGCSVTPGNARKVTKRLSASPQGPSPAPAPVPVPAPGPTSSTERLIALARAEVGYHEGRSGGHWNNRQKYSKELPGADWSDGQPWCDTWVHWLFWKAGLLELLPDVTAKAPAGSASCDVSATAWKRAHRWSEYPAIGAQAFYGSPADLVHTGLVIAYDADTITTIEGNTNVNGSAEGDGVYVKTRRRRDPFVVGYGYPKFVDGIKSADPAWGRPAAGSPVKPWPVDLVDLSHHNAGRIDWVQAKNAGVRGVYHKATQHTAFRDELYGSRRLEVRAFRIPFGAYHYAQPGKGSAVAQARFFIATAKPRAGDLRPMLDLEENGGLGLEALTRWTEDFVREVKRLTGKPPVLYTKFQLKRDPGCFLWSARYNPDNAAPLPLRAWPGGWTIHQFSNGEVGVPRRVAGIDMPVDLDTLKPGFDFNRLKL